jgi:mannose-6-phosphate isomerase-like protein (cupin superfamily)
VDNRWEPRHEVKLILSAGSDADVSVHIITDRIGVKQLLVDDTLPDAAHPLYFHHRVIPVGQRAHEAHVHPTPQVEAFFVIEGMAEVQLEDEVYQVSAGSGVVLNCARLHGFRNIGDTELRYVVMTAPGPPPAAALR